MQENLLGKNGIMVKKMNEEDRKKIVTDVISALEKNKKEQISRVSKKIKDMDWAEMIAQSIVNVCAIETTSFITDIIKRRRY